MKGIKILVRSVRQVHQWTVLNYLLATFARFTSKLESGSGQRIYIFLTDSITTYLIQLFKHHLYTLWTCIFISKIYRYRLIFLYFSFYSFFIIILSLFSILLLHRHIPLYGVDNLFIFFFSFISSTIFYRKKYTQNTL